MNLLARLKEAFTRHVLTSITVIIDKYFKHHYKWLLHFTVTIRGVTPGGSELGQSDLLSSQMLYCAILAMSCVECCSIIIRFHIRILGAHLHNCCTLQPMPLFKIHKYM